MLFYCGKLRLTNFSPRNLVVINLFYDVVGFFNLRLIVSNIFSYTDYDTLKKTQ